MRLIVGVSGASGAPYARRLLEWLAGPGAQAGIETHAVFTRTGRLVWGQEVGGEPDLPGIRVWGPQDMTAPFASGSARFDGMAVVPCSAGTLGRVAHGLSLDLLGRCADVCLKERRRLVLCLREAPYGLVHLRNMQAVTEAGGIVMPASPSFYSGPVSVDDLLDTVVGRVLDLMGVDNPLVKRWRPTWS